MISKGQAEAILSRLNGYKSRRTRVERRIEKLETEVVLLEADLADLAEEEEMDTSAFKHKLDEYQHVHGKLKEK